MKKFLLFFIFCSLISPPLIFAEQNKPENQFEISQSYGSSKILLEEGPGYLGLSEVFSQSFAWWKGRAPLFVFRHDNYDNDNLVSKYLNPTRENWGAALSLPYENWKLKLSGNVSVPEKGDNFEALGVYLEWKNNRENLNWLKKIEVGLETDNQSRSLISGILKTEPLEKIRLLSGIADEKIGTNSALRGGLGIVADYSEKYSFFLAGVKDFDSQRLTKVYGFARNALFAESGLNPGIILIYRDKPKSDYFLGLLTFGGKSLNKYANEGIFEAFFSGAFSGTRIINNKNFDKVGVSPLYKTNDYGKIVVSVSYSDIDLGYNLRLKSDEEMIFYAFGDFQKIKSPYVGAGRYGETYLYYHKKMRDEYASFYKTEIGWKIPLKNNSLNFAVSNSFGAEKLNWAGMEAVISLKF